jgi:hypothetical protein
VRPIVASLAVLAAAAFSPAASMADAPVSPALPSPAASPSPVASLPPPRPYVSLEEEYSPDYDDEAGQSVLLNLRAQLPYLENGQQYVIRVKLPFVTTSPAQAVGGVGDSTLTYLAVDDGGGGRWTYGATMKLPTAGDSSLGSGKYSIGPAGSYEHVSGVWSLSLGTTNYFSVIGPASRAQVAQTKIDPGAELSLPRGWAIGTSTMSYTYNWVPGTWINVPLGLRIEKAFGTNSGLPLAQLLAPIVGSAEFEKNLVAAADTPSWTIRVMLRWNLPRSKNVAP